MRPVLLSAWIAASLAWPAFDAHAQEASCDLMCRLQSYISTDHMAAQSDGAGAAPAPHPAKHRAHAAVHEGHPTAPTPSATAAPKPAAKPVAQTKGPVVAAKAAKPEATPKAAIVPKTASVARPPKPRVAAVPAAKPATSPAAASPPMSVATATPATEPAPKRTMRGAHAAVHFARRKPVPTTLADVALIPGSARLVPADFERFGKL